MGLFDKLKQTVSNAVNSEPDLSTLTPEQRQRYEMHLAQAEAARTGSAEAAQQYQELRTLRGPAADYLYGAQQSWTPPSAEELERIRQEQGMRAMIKASQPPNAGFRAQMGEALRDTVGMRKGPDEIDDPQQRQYVAASERAARDAARQPYRAPTVYPMTITRIPTRGKTQVQEVAAYLQQSGLAARPDLVWGVYRVPDRISPAISPASESGRLVEWDIVHIPAQLPPAPHLEVAHFSSRARWIARRLGEQALFDEDMGRIYAWYAGINPEDCLGIARHLSLRAQHSGEEGGGGGTETWVEGVTVLHRPGQRSAGTQQRMADAAPMMVDLAQVPPAHVELLDWTEIARIVHPEANRLPRVPNPIPYLPSTPQELLFAYLEVVGVLPGDCWSAQVTCTTNRALVGKSGFVTHNMGKKLPCADGKDRARLHGAEDVVIVYRDRPEYVAGRERWAAYQRDVLQARLDGASNGRHVVQRHDVDSAFLRSVLKPLEIAQKLDEWGVKQPPPPHRYCWPPIDA